MPTPKSPHPVHHTSHPSAFWPTWNSNQPFALALLILLAFSIVYLNAKISYTMQQQRMLDRPVPTEHTISVSGEGRAMGKPDVATMTFGVESKADDVPAAQEQNTTTVNALIEKFKAMGISADDIQTAAYSVSENMVWNPETQTSDSKGWVVSQQIVVKVRDTSKLSALIGEAGKSGITNTYGPNYTIDDPSALLAEARTEAIADAKQKAAELARALGVTLDALVDYSEYSGSSPMPYYSERAFDAVAASPILEPGTNELNLSVSLTYRLVD